MPTQLAAPRTFQDIFQPGRVAALCHPDRLAAVATFFGMQPQRVDNCRVLEIGSWTGRNLLPMAERHPDSRFMGVDPSAERVSAAQQLAERLKLDNAEFRVAPLDAIDSQLGTFDYIICHDVLSRAAPETEQALLARCRELLNPQGLVYLSFRTFPGALVPEILGDAAWQRASTKEQSAKRVAEAREVFQVLGASLPAGAAGYRRLLRNEVEFALELNDAAVFHEYLGEQSHPFFFHELVDQAAAQQLQYVGDTDIGTMFAASLGPEIESRLMPIVRDSTSLEQIMDFLRNRSYHRSLFCREDVALSRHWSPTRLEEIALAGFLRHRGDDSLTADGPARFETASGTTIASSSPPLKLALATIGQQWPQAIAFRQLVEDVGRQLEASASGGAGLSDSDREELGKNLIECVANGLIEPRAAADRFVVDVSDRPTASPWARLEAESQREVTNRLHEPVRLDEMAHSLLQYLDGQHDRAALLAVVQEAARTGRLSILREGIPAGQETVSGQFLEQALDQALTGLARSALLVA